MQRRGMYDTESALLPTRRTETTQEYDAKDNRHAYRYLQGTHQLPPPSHVSCSLHTNTIQYYLKSFKADAVRILALLALTSLSYIARIHPETDLGGLKMAPAIATARLRKELVNIKKDPPPGVIAEPDERNILKWHYAIRGPPGTGFEGGVYVGKLIFPNEYPMKPPGIMMLTPSGRFKPNTRLCLSMSDFHPESWNPMWSVATIIQGVQSFMASDELTTGGLKSPASEHRRLAALSHEFNTKMFPNLFEGDIEGSFRDADVAGLKSGPEVADSSSSVALDGSVPSAAPHEAILAKPTKARRSKRDKQPPVNESNDGILEEGLEKLALNKSEVEENTISAEELEKRKQRNAKRRAMQKQKRQVGASAM